MMDMDTPLESLEKGQLLDLVRRLVKENEALVKKNEALVNENVGIGSPLPCKRVGDKNLSPTESPVKRLKVKETLSVKIASSSLHKKSFTSFSEPPCLSSVALFHKTFHCPVEDTPKIPSPERCDLRLNLINEEVMELRQAINEGDLTEVADALADIQYVLSGTVHEFGMGNIFQKLFTEVHRSNMTKLCANEEDAEATVAHYLRRDGTKASYHASGDGFMVFRKSDSKTLKCVKYSPANLLPILEGAVDETAS